MRMRVTWEPGEVLGEMRHTHTHTLPRESPWNRGSFGPTVFPVISGKFQEAGRQTILGIIISWFFFFPTSFLFCLFETGSAI